MVVAGIPVYVVALHPWLRLSEECDSNQTMDKEPWASAKW